MANLFSIQTLNKISHEGLKRFPQPQYLIGNDVDKPDAILVRSQGMHDMVIPASVKAIARAGAGTNNIPIPAMSERGVPVFNAAGANANAVKELVLSGMLMAARNIIPSLQFTASLRGDDATLHQLVEDGKKNFVGSELKGRTLGVVGLGAIGRLVADMALGLGMKVYGYDPEITVDAAWSLSASVKKSNSIEELLKHCDFVSLHVPLLPATRGLINAQRLAVIKKNAILLNFSRDAIVDTEAVIASLENKHLRYYVCDFPEVKLQGHPHVIALPHLGASTNEAEDNCAVMVADQVRDYLEHGNLTNSVNFPNIVMPRESKHRISLAHNNVPNMLGQISTTLANASVNIHNMMNKSRGDLAYTLVDNDSPISEKILKELKAIPGVLLVRNLPLLDL
ncbi:phosphoglycerate dehydrogenase [Ferrovum sp. PN-J185]|uniref:phosphoglycerate dehydrogenase n=1 Tax=Ferrovum sp. PN-J185 TaxID=1356306 RepID=UPI00079BFBEA|nr:phosphoglycerate dehydrogenase [Ferrovum sp. PN-J185]KXW56486.1 D-3-phosphoglycerate dehydrogenase [Ferrovum sp. PN-J185]MCC6068165.1 phosphoglycerate dehydrogenase [Ferrovum sp. PN-J185]MDE1891722.1 phosphoglycerate dehydrogenase [Betaproteobacteria bacterium]MDE2056436.1 phosphoglycerate dehydrogenase [Betaproteobacteria bacterium]